MRRSHPIFFIVFLVFSEFLLAQEEVRLSSPNSRILFTLTINKGIPVYSISFDKNPLIANSSLNMQFEGMGMLRQAVIGKPSMIRDLIESYRLHVGKASSVKSSCRQVIIPLKDGMNPDYQLAIEVRVFNDGVAFRYSLPKAGKKSSFVLLEERTEFRFTTDPVVKCLLLPNYTTSHEGLYTTASLNTIREDTLIDIPALFQFPGKIFMAITEAALLDYAGMYLIKHNGSLYSQLSPLPGQQKIKVKRSLPHYSPWRVILLSDRVGGLIESNMITSLSPPTVIKDLGWVKPGTTTFPWWNGTVIPDSIKGGNNFATNKYYIDFCAANNIKYHSIVEYGGHEWYTNDGEGYQPGPNVDITKPVEGLDMKAICDYGRKKNVGIRVWTHWKALYPKLDKAFAQFEKWGLSGMMVDFMDRDDQEMVNIQTEILEKAAKHRLHIQFHGVHKPTGLHRTYPHEFTREAAMNYEYDKWDTIITPKADLDIVFTRMLAGSTDYHLGGFRALPVSKFRVQNSRPYVMGTRCHMLAMYIVLENYLPMVADYPDAYIGQPGFEVIKQVPGTWDESVVPAAEIDQFVSIARRKGDKWFIGTITNNEGRERTATFSFLPAGQYTAEIYSDAADAGDHADHLIKTETTIDRNSTLKMVLAPGGGNVIILNKLKK
jgi:alpha-glucosidase